MVREMKTGRKIEMDEWSPGSKCSLEGLLIVRA